MLVSRRKKKKKLHSDSQCQSIFFYSSVCTTREAMSMCEAMCWTAVLPYTNKMSSSSPLCRSIVIKEMSCDMVEKFQAFIYKLI